MYPNLQFLKLEETLSKTDQSSLHEDDAFFRNLRQPVIIAFGRCREVSSPSDARQH